MHEQMTAFTDRLLLWLVSGVVACAWACAAPVEEVDLGEFSKSPSAVAVVKDTSGAYWAVPVSRVKVDGTSLVVESETTVAKGSATGATEATEKRLANKLVDLLTAARPGGFGPTNFSESTGGTTVTKTVTTTGPDGKPVTSEPVTTTEGQPESISGQIEVLEVGARIEVAKVVLMSGLGAGQGEAGESGPTRDAHRHTGRGGQRGR